MRSSPENDPILLAEGEILVDQLLARLPERLALVLRYRLGLVYGEEWSHERIGQEFWAGSAVNRPKPPERGREEIERSGRYGGLIESEIMHSMIRTGIMLHT